MQDFAWWLTFSEAELRTRTNDNPADNSFNESISVEVGEQTLFLRSLGMQMRHTNDQLSPEGAAEYYWGLLIEPLEKMIRIGNGAGLTKSKIFRAWG